MSQIIIDRALLEHLSKLCRIDLPADPDTFLQQLNTTLTYAKKIDSLDLTGIEPFSYPLQQRLSPRSDTPHESLSQQETLQNAPDKELVFFKVPKVIEES